MSRCIHQEIIYLLLSAKERNLCEIRLKHFGSEKLIFKSIFDRDSAIGHYLVLRLVEVQVAQLRLEALRSVLLDYVTEVLGVLDLRKLVEGYSAPVCA